MPWPPSQGCRMAAPALGMGAPFLGATLLIPVSGRSICSSPRRWVAQGRSPSLRGVLEMQPHSVFPWEVSTQSSQGAGLVALAQHQNPRGTHPDLRDFGMCCFPYLEVPCMSCVLSVACHTAAGHPSIPNFGGETLLITEHMLPFSAQCRRQPAQIEVGSGWHGKKWGDNPGHMIYSLHAEEHQMQKAS